MSGIQGSSRAILARTIGRTSRRARSKHSFWSLYHYLSRITERGNWVICSLNEISRQLSSHRYLTSSRMYAGSARLTSDGALSMPHWNINLHYAEITRIIIRGGSIPTNMFWITRSVVQIRCSPRLSGFVVGSSAEAFSSISRPECERLCEWLIAPSNIDGRKLKSAVALAGARTDSRRISAISRVCRPAAKWRYTLRICSLWLIAFDRSGVTGA